MASVVLQELTKTFHHPDGATRSAVFNVSLTIHDRECFALVGPSGCGKTTTLRLIAGLEDPTRGSVAMGGRVINELPPKARDIAMVFQTPALYPHMSVYENMAFGLKVRGVAESIIRERVREAADLLELDLHLSAPPHQLSGGQRQLVALGRALVRRPKVFLFDEPLSNLDPVLRLQMRNVITRLHAHSAATLIYVTHDQGEALALGHRIGIMRHGELQQVAQPPDLFRKPANLFVAGFVGTPPMNLFPGVLSCSGNTPVFRMGTDIIIPFNQLPFPAELAKYLDQPLILGLRPEYIHVERSATSVVPGQCLNATVTYVQGSGPECWVWLKTGPSECVGRWRAEGSPPLGVSLSVRLDLGSARFFDPKSERLIV